MTTSSLDKKTFTMPDLSLEVYNTPMMKQYLEIKSRFPKEIVFFRLGDFYEMFLSDAEVASAALDLTLTGRGKGENRIPMCGVPFHAAENYITKLIKKGHKVAICEQTEDAAESKGITKRDVVKVITPGTVMNELALDQHDHQYLLAVSPGGDKSGQVGVAFADATTGSFYTMMVDQDRLSVEIERLMPREVLIPDSEWGRNLDITIPTTHYQPMATPQAETKLKKQFQVSSLDAFQIEDMKHAWSAACAVIRYLEDTQREPLSQLTKIVPVRGDDRLYMDRVTQRNLELVTALQPESSMTLFKVLNKTKTPMGARQLKQTIQSPLLQAQAIQPRLDAVEELKTQSGVRQGVEKILSRIQDIERVSARIVSNRNNPKDCLGLAQSLSELGTLAHSLEPLQSPVLKQYGTHFQSLLTPSHTVQQCKDVIDQSIRDDAPTHIRDGGVIKEGFDPELDALLTSFKDIRQWIANLEDVEREKTGIKSLKVGFNRVFGYYFEVSNTYKNQVPETYIRKQTLTNAERYITPELKEKETILLNGEEAQKKVEKKVYETVVQKVREAISTIQTVAGWVAELDCLQSLATVAHKNNYCRPQFDQSQSLTLSMKQSRHPVIEQQSGMHFMPNDLEMRKDQDRFILITGPNMAGKSTMMRQVALCVVMAQMGSFVPADQMVLSPVDKLFTRIGAMDNLYGGQSTFMVEMIETAAIVQNATENSLVVLDEIGRGTATYDGMSIAAAVSEYIHQTIGARTLFATHYHELTVLSDCHKGFGNYSLKIAESGNRIVFKYQLVKGSADKSYGVAVASMAGMPKEIVDRASNFLSLLESQGASLDTRRGIQMSLFGRTE